MIDKHLDFARLCHPERSAVRRAVEGSREGFTLVELLVYIAIVGIVVIVAGQAFSNSTKMRVRTQSMLKASEVAENVASIFKQDVAQTGAKSSMEAGSATGGDNFSTVYNDVYMDPNNGNESLKDYSSFAIAAQADGNSDLKVRRVRYDENGHYKAVEEVNWFVANEVLKRSCRTVVGTEDAENCKSGTAAESKNRAVDIASGVSSFVVKPAIPGITSGAQPQVFPPCSGGSCQKEFRMVSRTGEANFMGLTITPADDNKVVKLSGFVTNYKMNENDENKTGRMVNQVIVTQNATVSSWKNACTFTLLPNQEYELAFSLSDAGDMKEKMRLFVPGRDHMSVGFRLANGSRPMGLDDFTFYPPTDKDASGELKMRFDVSTKIENACMVFTFASYSPMAANGSLTISGVSLKKVESSNSSFAAGVLGIQDKKYVKTLLLDLTVKQNGEGSQVSVVVPIPSNGIAD